jgi:hypothetical protein
MSKYLSKTSVSICAGLFVLGTVDGWVVYTQRSHTLEKHVVGTNAWGIHLLLALGLAATIAVSMFYHAKAPKRPYNMWVAPFTKDALKRVKNTVMLKNGKTTGTMVRAVVVALLLLTMLFYFFRAGMQIIGSADPNFVINAWGGPTRLGASLAHWMDGVYLFYISAGIVALLSKSKSKAKKSKKRSR